MTAAETVQRMAELFDKYREYFGLDDTSFPEDGPQRKQCEFEDAFVGLMCSYYGHDIGPDQCGKPEHDLCYRCGRLRVEIETRP
jgi:hypothetical protein